MRLCNAWRRRTASPLTRLAHIELAHEAETLVVFIKIEHFADERVERDRLREHRLRPRVVAERVDHGLERLDLAHDRLRGAVDELAVVGRQTTQETPAQAFRGELDRRQRILDLVREAPRDLAPPRRAARD
jgi:hypothetical protein